MSFFWGGGHAPLEITYRIVSESSASKRKSDTSKRLKTLTLAGRFNVISLNLEVDSVSLNL